MKCNCEFNQLILDAYELSLKHQTKKEVMNVTLVQASIMGRVYIGNSSPTFREVAEYSDEKEEAMKQFLDGFPNLSPDMVALQSRRTFESDDIYEWLYVSHKVEEDALIVETKRGTKTFCF